MWYELSLCLGRRLNVEKSNRRENIPLAPDPALKKQKKNLFTYYEKKND